VWFTLKDDQKKQLNFWLLPDIFLLHLSTNFLSNAYCGAATVPTFSPIPLSIFSENPHLLSCRSTAEVWTEVFPTHGCQSHPRLWQGGHPEQMTVNDAGMHILLASYSINLTQGKKDWSKLVTFSQGFPVLSNFSVIFLILLQFPTLHFHFCFVFFDIAIFWHIFDLSLTKVARRKHLFFLNGCDYCLTHLFCLFLLIYIYRCQSLR